MTAQQQRGGAERALGSRGEPSELTRPRSWALLQGRGGITEIGFIISTTLGDDEIAIPRRMNRVGSCFNRAGMQRIVIQETETGPGRKCSGRDNGTDSVRAHSSAGDAYRAPRSARASVRACCVCVSAGAPAGWLAGGPRVPCACCVCACAVSGAPGGAGPVTALPACLPPRHSPTDTTRHGTLPLRAPAVVRRAQPRSLPREGAPLSAASRCCTIGGGMTCPPTLSVRG